MKTGRVRDLDLGTTAWARIAVGVPGAHTSTYSTGVDELQMQEAADFASLAELSLYTPVTPAASARPISEVSNSGGWSAVGGSDLAAVLADESATSYALSPSSPASAAGFTVQMGALLSGMSSVAIKVDDCLVGAASGTCAFDIYEGTTLRGTVTSTPAYSASGTTTQRTVSIPTSITSTIVDWTNVRVAAKYVA